jgi:hypothetical protein
VLNTPLFTSYVEVEEYLAPEMLLYVQMIAGSLSLGWKKELQRPSEHGGRESGQQRSDAFTFSRLIFFREHSGIL